MPLLQIIHASPHVMVHLLFDAFPSESLYDSILCPHEISVTRDKIPMCCMSILILVLGRPSQEDHILVVYVSIPHFRIIVKSVGENQPILSQE